MGARFRLKRGFDLSGFREDTKVILRAMKTYGLIVADNGSDWFFTGTAEDGWRTAMLDELKTIPAGAFEAVDVSGIKVSNGSGRVRTKIRIASLRANPPGPDVDALNGEYVVLVNRGTNARALGGWTIRNGAGDRYTFGPLVLKPRARIVLHTGVGEDRPGHRYWGRARPAWRNGGGTASLRVPSGALHHRLTYA
jgi:hypothetical protein